MSYEGREKILKVALARIVDHDQVTDIHFRCPGRNCGAVGRVITRYAGSPLIEIQDSAAPDMVKLQLHRVTCRGCGYAIFVLPTEEILVIEGPWTLG